MSREVRRVPIGWKHPTMPNRHWKVQQKYGTQHPASKLHNPDVQFVPLMDDYPAAYARWEQELAGIREGKGEDWEWQVKYHLTGYQGEGDSKPITHPFYPGEGQEPVVVQDVAHLRRLVMLDVLRQEPDPEDYMTIWGDEPQDQFGWVLYEEVSEGTPVTPVFATAQELIDHLATVGEDYDQVPYRREAAKALVEQGYSLCSMVVSGGQVYDSAKDADLLAAKLETT